MSLRFVYGPVTIAMLLLVIGSGLLLGAHAGIAAESPAELSAEIETADTEFDQTVAEIRAGEGAEGPPNDPLTKQSEQLADRMEAVNPLSKYNDRLEPYSLGFAAWIADVAFSVAIAVMSRSAFAAYHANQVLPAWAIIYPIQAVSFGLVAAALGVQLWRVRGAFRQ